jgi:hypothetical protein
MQHGLDTWEGLIRATGGALVNEKSRWWFVDFSFANNGDWRYKTKDELEGELSALDVDGTRKPIQRLEYNDPFETLGVKLDPTGSDDAIISDMHQWAQDWCTKIRRSFLHEHEVHIALQMTIQKKLEYPLTVINPSRQTCDRIMHRILKTALPKSGYNSHFPRKALYGPGKMMGGELHNLYATMVGKHLYEILTEAPYDSPTGNLLRTSIEQCKVELGLGGDLFTHDYKKLHHLVTECWITKVWQELHLNDIVLHQCTPNLRLRCTNDHFIMDAFIHTGYKRRLLHDLNQCRIYLQVTTVSDMTNGTGTQLLPQALHCERYHDILLPTYIWPIQPEPNLRQKSEWRKAIKHTFLCRCSLNLQE